MEDLCYVFDNNMLLDYPDIFCLECEHQVAHVSYDSKDEVWVPGLVSDCYHFDCESWAQQLTDPRPKLV